MFFKEFREKVGISQKEAFEKLGIQQATLAKRNQNQFHLLL